MYKRIKHKWKWINWLWKGIDILLFEALTIRSLAFLEPHLTGGKCFTVYVDANDGCNDIAFQLGTSAKGVSGIPTRRWSIKVRTKLHMKEILSFCFRFSTINRHDWNYIFFPIDKSIFLQLQQSGSTRLYAIFLRIFCSISEDIQLCRRTASCQSKTTNLRKVSPNW